MKYLKQFSIILAISFAGEVLNYVLPLPVPASIYGVVILFLCLEMKWIPLEEVKETAHFLVSIMAIMFVPAAVGLIDSFALMKEALIPYCVITVVVTIIVMVVAGHVTQFVIRRQKKGGETNE